MFCDATSYSLLTIRYSPFSVFAHAARPDRARPARDLGRDELGEVFGRAALRRRDRHADRLEALAQRRRLHGLVGRLGEAPDDGVGRALRERERAPAAAIETLDALLLGGGETFEAGRAIEPERDDRLDGL